MSMLWRQIRKRAFTLIELLVVIAIIALLAAILTPAINNALLKGRMTQVVGNGRGLYVLLFSQEMDNPLGLTSSSNVAWPTASNANSSVFFASVVESNEASGISFNFFAAPGIEPARDKASFIGGLHNAWCITADVSDKLPATVPVLFTQNIRLPNKQLNDDFSLNADANPFGSRGCVVVQRGGSAFTLDKGTAMATNFNPIGSANIVLYPAGGQL